MLSYTPDELARLTLYQFRCAVRGAQFRLDPEARECVLKLLDPPDREA